MERTERVGDERLQEVAEISSNSLKGKRLPSSKKQSQSRHYRPLVPHSSPTNQSAHRRFPQTQPEFTNNWTDETNELHKHACSENHLSLKFSHTTLQSEIFPGKTSPNTKFHIRATRKWNLKQSEMGESKKGLPRHRDPPWPRAPHRRAAPPPSLPQTALKTRGRGSTGSMCVCVSLSPPPPPLCQSLSPRCCKWDCKQMKTPNKAQTKAQDEHEESVEEETKGPNPNGWEWVDGEGMNDNYSILNVVPELYSRLTFKNGSGLRVETWEPRYSPTSLIRHSIIRQPRYYDTNFVNQTS
jgi:hypothetical protein